MKKTASILSILLALLMVMNVTAFAAGGDGGGDKLLTLVSAKVGDADLLNSKVAPGSEIVLTFSNNVTDESVLAGNISKIKVKTADGSAADSSVAPSKTDRQVFIVTLGSLAKGDYNLTIGKELAAKNGNTLGEKVDIAFSVKGDGSGTGGGNNPLDVVSVKAGDSDLEGAELEASGNITVTFSRGMTDNQAANFEQIGIYGADGSKVDGVTYTDFKKNDEGNSYTVLTYSNLEGGSYTLKLGADLKANNGNTLGAEKTYTFTVKGEEGEPDEEPTGFQAFINAVVNFFMNAINAIKTFFAGLFA